MNLKSMSSTCSTDYKKIEPLPILTVVDDEDNTGTKLKLNVKNLEKVLLNPRVSNCKLMIVSIYGRQRTGKSLLMNFCIRYLHKKRMESLIANQDALDGFDWGPSDKSMATGIYIWSEPFFTETLNKSKVAVLLLDCQAQYQNKSSIAHIIPLYAFCNLMSSVQIHNIFNQMTEMTLQLAALTCDYANLFQTKSYDDLNKKSPIPYQTMFFLLRDWPYSYEFFYGSAVGQQYINRFLSTQQKTLPPRNLEVRQFLSGQYQDIYCFLMPHPGLKASMAENFIGKWDSLSDDFQEHVHNFMKTLFSTANVAVKKVGDQYTTGREMLTFTENCYKNIIATESPKTGDSI